ncbi:Uncharacterised protein [Escherichia coli]|nr:Uncharacterised protein [Escherichia coli]
MDYVTFLGVGVIFMPDNEATVKAFHDAYGFDEEEVNIIRSLKVKQQSYIKIPDMQIAKVVNLFVEAEQYAVVHQRLMKQPWQRKYGNVNQIPMLQCDRCRRADNEV